MVLLMVATSAACGPAGRPPVPGQPLLTAVSLLRGSRPDGPVSLAAFAPSQAATPAKRGFQGRLRLQAAPGMTGFAVIRDDFDMASDENAALRAPPPMDIEFTSAGGRLLPTRRGLSPGRHPAWDYSVQPGVTWREPADGPFSRAALPFTLHERNANCVHHGLLTFLYDETGRVSAALYQVSAETCQYLKFDMWGAFEATLEAGPADGPGASAAAPVRRMPLRSIADLPAHFPGAAPDRFGSVAEVDPADMTVFGFVADGIHFIGGCATRHGPHPQCEELVLPSYSLAKSLFAGLAVMRAEKLYPGIAQTRIGEVVDACRDNPAWRDVSIAHALDMATGNYHSAEWMADEDAAVLDPFFLAEDHGSKVAAACSAYPRRAAPGTRWVYHTSDTYLAGAALRAALRARLGRDVDLYEELVWRPVFERLGLSAIARDVLRTYDPEAQPFFGWGMYLQPDDVARLAAYLGPERGYIGGEAVLDEAMFAAALQRDASNRGLPADMEGMVYKNGFRALDVAPYLGCQSPAQVVVLSGFGGIVLALFPNDTAYYYFSDGGSLRWLEAARESHRLRPFCT
jgi:hypothetical protein